MKIIFIHGYTASKEADWYPNISRELETLKISYAIPSLPGGEHPHTDEWLAAIHKEVTASKEPIILVGHSLGARAALLYLEKYPSNIRGLVLIAAFANSLENAKRKDEAIPDFFRHIIDTEKIKSLTDTRIVMHSMDDDSIPYRQGQEIARDIDAHLLTYRDRGHFFEPENYTYVLDVLKNILNIK